MKQNIFDVVLRCSGCSLRGPWRRTLGRGMAGLRLGVHRFTHPWQQDHGQVGEAKFIHLWQYKDGAWKITQVISEVRGIVLVRLS
jgi:hypothetical protein